MTAGKYKHRVRFDRLVPLTDSNGDVIQNPVTGAVNRDWVAITTAWASIEALSAREMIASQATQAEYSGRIECRYDSRLTDTTNLRAVHVVNGVDAAIFAIVGPSLPDKDTGREYLTFAVRTGLTQGE